MEAPRRFEIKKGNKEQFWEIWRIDATITTRSGKIGDEEKRWKESEKDCADYQTAQVEFDRLIRQKIAKGFHQVARPSEPSPPTESRAVRLVTIENGHGLTLSDDFFVEIFHWMLDMDVMEKSLNPPDLSRWENRALRMCRMDDFPSDNEGFQQFFR